MHLPANAETRRAVFKDIAFIALPLIGIAVWASSLIASSGGRSLETSVRYTLNPELKAETPEEVQAKSEALVIDAKARAAAAEGERQAREVEAVIAALPPPPAEAEPGPALASSPPPPQQAADGSLPVLIQQMTSHQAELQRVETRLGSAIQRAEARLTERLVAEAVMAARVDSAVSQIASKVDQIEGGWEHWLLGLILATLGADRIPALHRHLSTGDRRRSGGGGS